MIMRHSVQTSRSQTIGRGPSGSAWDRRTAHTTVKVIMATAMSRRVEVLRFRIDSFRIDLCCLTCPSGLPSEPGFTRPARRLVVFRTPAQNLFYGAVKGDSAVFQDNGMLCEEPGFFRPVG